MEWISPQFTIKQRIIDIDELFKMYRTIPKSLRLSAVCAFY